MLDEPVSAVPPMTLPEGPGTDAAYIVMTMLPLA